MDEEEAVAEVDDDQRERGRDERDPEAVHLAQQRPRELKPELRAVHGEEGQVDRERAGEVADDHAERALLPDDDEEQRSRAIVTAMFARLASTNAVDRSSARNSDVSCS